MMRNASEVKAGVNERGGGGGHVWRSKLLLEGVKEGGRECS